MKQTGSQIIEQGMKWIRENKSAYVAMRDMVKSDVQRNPGRDLRIISYVEQVRRAGVSVPNAIRPYLSRRLAREVEGARFSSNRSKIDALMED